MKKSSSKAGNGIEDTEDIQALVHAAQAAEKRSQRMEKALSDMMAKMAEKEEAFDKAFHVMFSTLLEKLS